MWASGQAMKHELNENVATLQSSLKLFTRCRCRCDLFTHSPDRSTQRITCGLLGSSMLIMRSKAKRSKDEFCAMLLLLDHVCHPCCCCSIMYATHAAAARSCMPPMLLLLLLRSKVLLGCLDHACPTCPLTQSTSISFPTRFCWLGFDQRGIDANM